MSTLGFTLLFVVLAYLIGSVSFAVVVSRLFGLSDPRTYGSQNPGATNVLRSGHKFAAGLTLAGDCFKGWFALWLAHYFGPRHGLGDGTFALVAVAAFLGHLWPVFFRFVGGKGVATALGVLLGINLWLGLFTAAVWLAVAFVLRYSSLAALIAALFAPFCYGMLFGTDEMLAAVLAMSALLVYRHRVNIGNLMQGRESRLGSNKKGSAQ